MNIKNKILSIMPFLCKHESVDQWDGAAVKEIINSINRIEVSEQWDKNIYIEAKVTTFNFEFVECNCLMDKENNYFEIMSFPRIVFDKIKNLSLYPYLILNIKSKPSSIQINIIDDDKSIDKNIFELKDK